MIGNAVQLWKAPNVPAIPDTLSDPGQLAARAVQLRDRERSQIAANFQAGNYEMASAFVWLRTMALLKRQLAALGMEFIGELLQRPDIDEFTDVQTAVSDSEAISLAQDLGIITPLQTMRLTHSRAVVSHFASTSSDPAVDQDEIMTQEEAILCLRVCIQGVLGHQQVNVAEDFKSFRSKLESETLTSDSPEIQKLDGSPYFFVRTAISVLLTLFKMARGAQLEHTARNALLIMPRYWNQIKQPERWQIGKAYAEQFNEGRKEAVRGLHAVLVAVSGFDFVPENLRSNTFIKVANSVIAAHQAMDNFYNEPAPMRELASLGTSIPSPALAVCMTAILCVKLGNYYGVSRAAQSAADQVIVTLSVERWLYYLNERLEEDRLILPKLQEDKPITRWISLVSQLAIDLDKISQKNVKALITATRAGDRVRITNVAAAMFRKSINLP
jgi:hypothetical protein